LSPLSRRRERIFQSSLALVLALAACAPSRPTVESTPGGFSVRSARLGPGTKKVVAKRPPQLLLADDGTGCDVAPNRFRDTPVGTLVECEDWREAP
jgi:hypothetical protein